MAHEPLLLMTPGPTRVPERVLRAGARPMLHHRSPEFSVELATMLELIAPVFGTRMPVLPVHTTGRGALEATICNLFSAGDEIAVCCNGKFGEMWAGFAESYGLVVHRVCTDWGVGVDSREIEQCLDEHRAVQAVAFAHCESSTGASADVATVCRIARARNVLTLVDGVSSIGGLPFAFDEWEVDVAVTASQKCLMASPGLSFAVLSSRAWSASAKARLPRNYWDLLAIRNSVTKDKPETPGTTPVHLVLQVAESLRQMHEEGLLRVYERHNAMAECARRGARQLGLALQCPEMTLMSATLTALATPAGVAPKALRDAIKSRAILTAAGLGRYQSTGFRIGHMGDIRVADVERTIAAVGEALAEVQSATR